MPLKHPPPSLYPEGLSIINPKPVRLRGPCLLHELVSPTSRDGTSSAVDFLSPNGRRTTLSYEDLHAAATGLASHIYSILAPSPVLSASEPRDPIIIPVLCPQSPQLYVAILAVLKVGSAFCPLNADAPPDRLKFILQDVKAKVILADQTLVSKLPQDNSTFKAIPIDHVLDPSNLVNYDFISPFLPEPEDPAYVMYTSGSTGTPKGVSISHLAATQSLLAHDRHIPQFSRFLQFAAPTFDVSVFEIFFPLFRGATLVGCNRAEMLTDLPGVLNAMDVDACELTPSVAGSLLKQRYRAPKLRLLLTIGEMLTEPVIKEFGGDDHKVSMLWGMYGPTEATIHCTLQPSFASTSGRELIGKPLDTVSAFVIRVVDDDDVAPQFEILPVGAVGELALGGFQLATGYLNRPQQTSKSFIDTKWGRVYKTGDKARFRSDGTIECLGRIDDGQVKLNGQRLELGEIESVFLRDPNCHSAFATIISNVLVAFAAVDSVSEAGQRLLDQCRSWLPAYMVPTDTVTMPQLPRLPSGKIDRKKLVHDYVARSTGAAGNVEEALDDQERLLCEVASSLLGYEIGPLTEFTPGALDSLAAIVYASTLRERGVNVGVIDILSAKTPRELGEKISQPSGASMQISGLNHLKFDLSELKATLGTEYDQVERLELSTPLQQSMIAETLKDGSSYINHLQLEIPSSVSLEVLLDSLRVLVQNNEILRTGFVSSGNQLCQVIWKQLDDSQIVDCASSYGNDVEIFDKVERFLLRPLMIRFQHLSQHLSPTGQARTLTLTLHHAIYDGWTIDLLTEDLSLLLRGKQPIARPQFSEISQFLHDVPEPVTADAMEFWTDQLRGVGAASLPNLSTVVESGVRRSFQTTKLPLHPRALADLTQRAFVGPQVLFQACLAWLWAAVHGSEDIVIGSVSSGRSLPVAGIDKIMGPCMTTLPLQVNVSRFRTILELLQSIHSTNRKTLKHGHLPLSQINRAAGLSVNSKLFDIIFAYQDSPNSRKQGPNVVRELWHRDATEAKLVVEIQPCQDHFLCHTTSQAGLLPDTLVETFISHLGDLIMHFAKNTDAAITDIPHCFPSTGLSHYNDGPCSVETARSLSDMVEISAARHSSEIALCFATSITSEDIVQQTMTYGELNSKANQISRRLQQYGVVPGGAIAIIMEKSLLLYCSILAILKTGCAYIPILPSTPGERIKVILEQAEPCLCLVETASSVPKLGEVLVDVIVMGEEDFSSYPDANLGVASEPSQLAYVIYTSGTTGTPKGVAVTNKNILSNISVLSDIFPHKPSDNMLQACSQAFDVSVFEIFFAWANGMCLCAATNDDLFGDFERSVRAFAITHLSVTVTVASLLNPDNVPSVNFLVTSGEPMTDEVLVKWAQHLYQGYGPSETTNICTVRKVTKCDSPRFLGWSFDNTSAFVLRPKSLDLVPLGCMGELCFGGDQVAAGYLKLPEVTAKGFIHHPTYGRLYRSGDLGRMLPDGSLIIHGRIDTQVKLRGLRIDIREIELTALATGVARTFRIVLLTTEGTKNQQLALFYVPKGHESHGFQLLSPDDGIRGQLEALRHGLEARLPAYMVPAFLFPVSSLPMTPSGKVDDRTLRNRVAQLSVDDLSTYSSAIAPGGAHSDWSETEELIADVIIDTLQKDRSDIYRWTTFPALGIDSISAMPVARVLRQRLQKQVNLSLVLQNPSINRLASAIDAMGELEESNNQRGRLLPIELIGLVRKRLEEQGKSAEKVLPCTPLQEAMIMASSRLPSKATEGTMTYYNQMVLHLRVPCEPIMRHWNDVIQRHEILRSCFLTTDNIRYPAVQATLQDHVPKWEILEADDGFLRECASRHLLSALGHVERLEPPISLAIIRTPESGDYLSFVCHHAMYDGIAMQILLSEVESLCRGIRLPPAPTLEPFLCEIQASPPGHDEFWRRLFLGFRPTPLNPAILATDPMPSTISSRASLLPLGRIEAQLRLVGVSMLAMCQMAWAVTLSIVSKTTDVSFGNVVAGRSVSVDRVDNLVAPCFNTLPMRLDMSELKFMIDAMERLQGQNAKMISFQFSSLRQIQKMVKARERLFDSLLILQPRPLALDDGLWSLVFEEGAMDIPVVCEITPDRLSDTLALQLHRDKSKISHPALQLMGSIFSHVLDLALKFPSSHLPTRDSLPSQWRQDVQELFPSPTHTKTESRDQNSAGDEGGAWTEVEFVVRKTLSKLVERPEDQVDRLTTIYQYGLDSITAIQLATLLRRQGVNVSAMDIIQNPTCAGIACCAKVSVEEDVSDTYDFDEFQGETKQDIHDSGIDLESIEAVLPCTATQQGLLFQFQESKGRYYLNFSSWTLEGRFETDEILGAWSELASHHQILRTGFIPVNHPDTTFAMVAYSTDYSSASVSVYEAGDFDLEQWSSDVRRDVTQSLAKPPWRVALVKSDGDDSPLQVHLAIHHALYDGFTLRRVLADLDGIIRRVRQKPKVVKLERALSHYFHLSRSGESAGDAYWKSKASDFVTHKFPVMTPLSVTDSHVSRVSLVCETSSSALRQAASKLGATLQAVLQATLTRILASYTGEARVTFGVVFDGRTTSLAQEATFPMISSVPVMADNVPSNVELVQQMMKYNADVRPFQLMPLTRVQRCLGVTDALFDTILIYQPADTRLDIDKTCLRLVNDVGSVEYPISMEVEELPSDTTQLNLTFNTGILPPEQAVILLAQFEAIMGHLLCSGEKAASPLSATRPDLFSALYPKQPVMDVEANLLHELFERSAQLLPSATALEFVENISDAERAQKWTYRELDELGNQAAQFIIEQGVEPGSIVATCFEKCPTAYFALLGILKTGCTFLCLDPSAPPTRQKFILDDSKASLLLLDHHYEWSDEASLPVHVIDERILASLPVQRPSLIRPVLPSDSCYCLYTSGTTGTPKGCLITHENAVQAMAAFKQLFTGRWDANSRWLQFAAFHFDVSVLEQYWSWYVGITVVAAPKDVMLSDITATISRLAVTHIDLTPSLARLTSPEECPTLCRGVFITGGEKLRSDVLDTWGSERVIHNAYGPTEATIGVTMNCGVPENGRPSNIGNLFPNVGAYVFEPGTETPVLRGGVGELCLTGKLVGKGYLNREGLTKERFPVLESTGERYYRTGDLVRVLHDEAIDFLGRADDQVKLRGQRLEIGEINHGIRESLPDKTSDVATVVTKRSSQSTDLIVSFVALSTDGTSRLELQVFSDKAHLELAARARDACRSRLAVYMVPSFIICVSHIPLSTNNKADINKLKKLFAELSQQELQVLASPSEISTRQLNKLESKILEAVHLVTRVREEEEEQVYPSTTIYQLGIDSITVSRLAKQLRTMGFTTATPSLILRNPQICQLSQALVKSDSAPVSVVGNSAMQFRQRIKSLRQRHLGLCCSTLHVEAAEVEYIAPCTPLQQGIIARAKTRGTQSAYFNQFRIALSLDVSIERLRDAFSRVVSSYAILRTAFVETPDGHVQVALANCRPRWLEVEVNADSESLDGIASERRQRWVDANQHVIASPVEVDHVVVVGGRHCLLLRLFHAIYDAQSLRVILESLEAEYTGRPLPPSPSFLSVLAEGPYFEHQGSHPFWKGMLRDHRFQPMPSLIESDADRDVVITRARDFPGLEDRRKALQVTHQTLLQAAWLQTLRRYFVEPPTIGVILSGRSLAMENIDRVVGPLFNTLPLRVGFSDTDTWTTLARKIQEVNNGLLAYVHTPLRDIQKLCTSGQPIFDTLFTFDRDEQRSGCKEWSIEESGAADAATANADYPLAIEVILARDDKLKMTLAAQKGIADAEALDKLLGRFVEAVDLILTSPEDVLERQSRIRSTDMETTGSTLLAEASDSTFEWSDTACTIRRELATLVKMDEEEIAATANLFALGLDSIDMIRFAGRLTRLGYDVSFSTLMKQPTLRAIVGVLEEEEGEGEEEKAQQAPNTTTTTDRNSAFDSIVSILQSRTRDSVQAVLPPTPLQDSMVAEMIRSGFETYFNHDVLEVPPDVDLDRLKTALETVYAASPVLRTVFAEVDDARVRFAYYQIVPKESALVIPSPVHVEDVEDISRVTDAARKKAIEGNGMSGLFQVHFAECRTRRFMVLSIAHALYDGWSLEMLHRDIQAAYEGAFTPRQSYQPYLSRILSLSNSSAQKFWTDTMSGATARLLPKLPSTPAQNNTTHRIQKPSTYTAAKIREMCKKLGITPQILGQGCWAAILSTLSRSLDVVFGVVLSGRDTEEAQALMFPTMNTVPLRLALHGTVEEFLAYVRDVMGGVLGYRHTALRDIQRGGRIFNTIFLLQNVRGNEEESIRKKSFLRSVRSVSEVDYPLCVELELTDGNEGGGEGGAFWNIAGDSDYVTSDQVAGIADALESVLGYFAHDASAQVLVLDDSSRVSVCGLSPVTLQLEAAKGQDAVSNGVGVNEEEGRSEEGEGEGEDYDALIDVLSELSGVDRQEISLDMSIFHVGLDSISAIKASSMLRKRGVEITTRDLVTSSSIREVLELVRSRPKGQSETETRERTASSLPLDYKLNGTSIAALVQRAGIPDDATEAVLPALPMQVHMLSVWQNTRGQTFFPCFSYNISHPESISREDITQAWQMLVDEMPMLRTILIGTIANTTAPPFLQVMLRSTSARERAVSDLKSDDGNTWEFVYSASPFAVVKFRGGGKRDTEMHLRIHHALYDAVSLPIMLDRFVELCSYSSTSSTPTLDPQTQAQTTAAAWYDFAMNHVSPSVQTQREEFWKSYLLDGGHDVVTQLRRRRRSRNNDDERERVHELPRGRKVDGIATLKKKLSERGISVQALLLAAYARVFARWGHDHDQSCGGNSDCDCVFGIYLANRSSSSHPGLETAPFPTLSILPLRVESPLSRDRDVFETAEGIQRDVQAISSAATVGLWEVEKWTCGMRVGTCVNVLSSSFSSSFYSSFRGEGEGEDGVGEKKGGGVVLEKIDAPEQEGEEGREDLARLLDGVVKPGSEVEDEGEGESGSESESVRGCYEGIIDFEMALRVNEDDNNIVLDVGVFGGGFGFSDALTGAEAREMIKEIEEEVRMAAAGA